jgi:hypothetical protein
MNVRIPMLRTAVFGMRKKLFTQSVLAQIRRWVREGLTPAEIARKIGCTVGTLQVRCSQEGISLRIVSTGISKKRLTGISKTRLSVSLASGVRDHLQARAASMGISESSLLTAIISLLTAIIETIDKDDLYGCSAR